jgi:anti-sigma-K factor RskA
MTDTDLSPSDILAAEYVLGVLTAPERAQVERRLNADPALAADVAAWEARLAPLIDEIDAAEPPAVVWRRVSAQLGLPATPPRSARGVWNSLPTWRAATAVAGMAAAVCLSVLLTIPKAPSIAPAPETASAGSLTSVALLKPETGPAAFVVTYDQPNQRLIIAPVSIAGRADRSLQLWLMPTQARPISLGLLDASRPLVLRVDQLVGPEGPRATLGVSLEPLGGAPGGQPTGPVVASGKLSPV